MFHTGFYKGSDTVRYNDFYKGAWGGLGIRISESDLSLGA